MWQFNPALDQSEAVTPTSQVDSLSLDFDYQSSIFIPADIAETYPQGAEIRNSLQFLGSIARSVQILADGQKGTRISVFRP